MYKNMKDLAREQPVLGPDTIIISTFSLLTSTVLWFLLIVSEPSLVYAGGGYFLRRASEQEKEPAESVTLLTNSQIAINTSEVAYCSSADRDIWLCGIQDGKGGWKSPKESRK